MVCGDAWRRGVSGSGNSGRRDGEALEIVVLVGLAAVAVRVVDLAAAGEVVLGGEAHAEQDVDGDVAVARRG